MFTTRLSHHQARWGAAERTAGLDGGLWPSRSRPRAAWAYARACAVLLNRRLPRCRCRCPSSPPARSRGPAEPAAWRCAPAARSSCCCWSLYWQVGEGGCQRCIAHAASAGGGAGGPSQRLHRVLVWAAVVLCNRTGAAGPGAMALGAARLCCAYRSSTQQQQGAQLSHSAQRLWPSRAGVVVLQEITMRSATFTETYYRKVRSC